MAFVEPRPRAVRVVSIFLFVATGIAFILGASLLLPNPLIVRLWELNKPAEAAFRALGRVSGVPLLFLGIGTFAAGRGLLEGKKWAWWFAVVVFFINGIGDIVSFIVTGDWIRSASGVAISAAFLIVLGRKPVRRFARE